MNIQVQATPKSERKTADQSMKVIHCHSTNLVDSTIASLTPLQLTEGRSARDQPKQPPAKKIHSLKGMSASGKM